MPHCLWLVDPAIQRPDGEADLRHLAEIHPYLVHRLALGTARSHERGQVGPLPLEGLFYQSSMRGGLHVNMQSDT